MYMYVVRFITVIDCDCISDCILCFLNMGVHCELYLNT